MPEGRLTFIHVALFVATCLSTLAAGAMMKGAALLELLKVPARLLDGVPFSATLMTILLTHEMGHYLMSKYHGTPASLPYFIPAPSFIGTMGAVIKMRPPIIDRRALMDIGAAGPLAGFVVAVIAVVVGLFYSDVVPITGIPDGTLALGDSLMFKLLSYLVLGVDPDKNEVMLHPVAFAGWIGMFITTLNLLPIGQLDGGHINYALFGPERHALISTIAIPVLIALGFWLWPGWAVWGVLMLILGKKHPPVVLPFVELDHRRKLMGWLSIVVFLITFMPVPFKAW